MMFDEFHDNDTHKYIATMRDKIYQHWGLGEIEKMGNMIGNDEY